jgi:hypothetical protein
MKGARVFPARSVTPEDSVRVNPSVVRSCPVTETGGCVSVTTLTVFDAEFPALSWTVTVSVLAPSTVGGA